jgi:hypothetical protein
MVSKGWRIVPPTGADGIRHVRHGQRWMALDHKESNMMRAVILVFVCLVVLTATPARAGSLVNGSFEFPSLPTGSFTNFPGGETGITGWTVVGIDSTVVNTFTQNGITFQVQEGNQWIDLAGVTSNSRTSGVTQGVATKVGQSYALDFYVGSATDNLFFFPSTVDLSIDGGARVGYTNPIAPSDRLDWKLFTVEFTATNTTTNLTFFNGSAPNNFLGALDNVSLRAVPAGVPEPASLVLLAASLIAGSVWSRRSRRNTRRPRTCA